MKKAPPRRITAKQYEELKARIMYLDIKISIDVWDEKMEFRVSVLDKPQVDAIRDQLLKMAKGMVDGRSGSE